MKRLVVIDDQEEFIDWVKRKADLSNIPLSFYGFTEPSDGLDFVLSKPCDICVLDFMLGTTNGYMLAKQIREKKPYQKIFIVSGYGVSQIKQQYPDVFDYVNDIYSKELGEADWLNKCLLDKSVISQNKMERIMSNVRDIVLHDINNTLLRVTMNFEKLLSGEDSSDDIKTRIKNSLSMLYSYVNILHSGMVLFNIYDAVELAVQEAVNLYDGTIEINNDSKIMAEASMVYVVSMVKNFIDNAYEAAERRQMLTKLKIKVSSFSNTIIIEDNAGGFDKSKIANGKTSKKGNGHGVALDNFLKAAHDLGIDLKIDSVLGKGTTVLITLKSVSE